MQDASPERIPPCPGCAANVLCRGCTRQFVARPRKGPAPAETQELVLRLLRERMALRAIARSVGVSRSWFQKFVNRLYREDTPFEPGPLKKSRAT